MAAHRMYYTSYEYLLSEMTNLTGREFENDPALWVIWYPIFILARQGDSGSTSFRDTYEKFVDESHYTWREQQRYIEHLIHIPQLEQQYRLSDDLNNLGTHWKTLLREQSEPWTRLLITWIEKYRQELLPAANAVIEKYENRDARERRKAYYREYRSMLLCLQRKLEVLAESFKMLNGLRP